MMNKSVMLRILLVVVVLLIGLGVVVFPMSGEKPFQKIEIREASVKKLVTQESFVMPDVEGLQAVLSDIVIYEEDDSWRQMNGISYVLTLVLTDGTQMEIREGGSFIAIDEIGYRAEYKPCEKLNDFVHSYMKTN